MSEKKTPPVVVEQIIDAECINQGKFGDGVFKHEGFIIIAKSAEVGQVYRLQINKVLSNIAFADIVE